MSVYARFGGATNIGIRYRDPWVPGKSWEVGYNFEYFHRDRTNELDQFNEKSDEASPPESAAAAARGRPPLPHPSASRNRS